MSTIENNQPSRNIGNRELIVVATSDLQPAAPLFFELQDAAGKWGATLRPLFVPLGDEAPGVTDDGPLAGQMSRFFSVDAADHAMENIADDLRQRANVEAVYIKPAGEPPLVLNSMAPSAAPPAPATPNFTSRQGYLGPAPDGVDALAAAAVPGGGGKGVRIIDLEWNWENGHEDLAANFHGLLFGTVSGTTAHGTAVIGEMGGDVNGFGITGICPSAWIATGAFSVPSATAIRAAATRLGPGDILLLEIHRPGPRFAYQNRPDQRGYIAIEWWPDDLLAIQFAVARGIIVVEAAGNGGENLDDVFYDAPDPGFPVGWRNPFSRVVDSGAVVVGAGAPPPNTHGRNWGPDRSRLAFSNYGRAVDAQGWGMEVTSTGYGDLQGGPDPLRWYTDKFGGTSSASPIVAGALACLQGARRAAGKSILNSLAARAALRHTGSPQQASPTSPLTERIGNRPDLSQLLQLP